MPREKGAYSVQAVIKAIDLLETLAQDGDSPSITLIEKKLTKGGSVSYQQL